MKLTITQIKPIGEVSDIREQTKKYESISVSRWPKAIQLKKASTQTVVNALNTIFSRNGYPRVMVADNGSQFTSKVFSFFPK